MFHKCTKHIVVKYLFGHTLQEEIDVDYVLHNTTI